MDRRRAPCLLHGERSHATLCSRPVRASAPHRSAPLVFALALGLVACEDADRDTIDESADAGGDGPQVFGDGPCEFPLGVTEHDIEAGGESRRYLLWYGEEVDPEVPPAVIFAWHGFGGGPHDAAAMIEVEARWRDAIVVAPQGLDRTLPGFPDAQPGFQTQRGEQDDRDIALFDAIESELAALGCLDEAREYSTGFSNGGFMTNVIACHRGDRLAAAAPGGAGGPFDADCREPVPMFIFHGRRDSTVPYDFGLESRDIWLATNGCDSSAAPDDGCAAAPGCPDEAPVEFCSYDLDHEPLPDDAARIEEFFRTHVR